LANWWSSSSRCSSTFGRAAAQRSTVEGLTDQIQAGRFRVGVEDAHIDELNLSAGFLALFGDRLQLSVGAVVPLKGGDDRTFDWQVGVHGSYYFGPSAQDRSRAARVTGF